MTAPLIGVAAPASPNCDSISLPLSTVREGDETYMLGEDVGTEREAGGVEWSVGEGMRKIEQCAFEISRRSSAAK